jgi:hypothetical protein
LSKEFGRVATLSADLYKIYVNHLLDILNCAGVGAKIGEGGFCIKHSIIVGFLLSLFSLPTSSSINEDISGVECSVNPL